MCDDNVDTTGVVLCDVNTVGVIAADPYLSEAKEVMAGNIMYVNVE